MAERADQYIVDVFTRLASNPTAQDLDFLVEAYNRVGYLAAEAEGLADMAEAERKYEEATRYSEAKAGAERVTDEAAKNFAYLQAFPHRKAEVKAREKATKLKNLLAAIEQAINAIKFLGRYDSPISPTIRTPGP